MFQLCADLQSASPHTTTTSAHNYLFVASGSIPLFRQIQIARETNILVGVVGAALTLTLFLAEQASVFVVFCGNRGAGNGHYKTLQQMVTSVRPEVGLPAKTTQLYAEHAGGTDGCRVKADAFRSSVEQFEKAFFGRDEHVGGPWMGQSTIAAGRASAPPASSLSTTKSAQASKTEKNVFPDGKILCEDRDRAFGPVLFFCESFFSPDSSSRWPSKWFWVWEATGFGKIGTGFLLLMLGFFFGWVGRWAIMMRSHSSAL